LEKKLPLQNDKETLSKVGKDTIGDKSDLDDSTKKDNKPNSHLSQDNNKINTHSTLQLPNPNKTSYTSINAIDSTSNPILPNLVSTNEQKDNKNHLSLSTSKDDKEDVKNVLDTGKEIEKIQSDILKTLRRLEDNP
jgi:hypothetical protein